MITYIELNNSGQVKKVFGKCKAKALKEGREIKECLPCGVNPERRRKE